MSYRKLYRAIARINTSLRFSQSQQQEMIRELADTSIRQAAINRSITQGLKSYNRTLANQLETQHNQHTSSSKQNFENINKQLEGVLDTSTTNQQQLEKKLEAIESNFSTGWWEKSKNFLGNITAALAILAVIWEIKMQLTKKDRLSTVKPEHLQDTKISQTVEKLLSEISEEKIVSRLQGTPQYKIGIHGVILLGAPGLGVSRGLDDLRSSFGDENYFLIDCTNPQYFYYQIIRLATQLGMRQIKGENQDHQAAVAYLAKKLAQHPGWVMGCDNFMCDAATQNMFLDFLTKLEPAKQRGRIVIALQPEINKNNENKSVQAICDKFSQAFNSTITFHEKPVYLNAARREKEACGFTEQRAISLLETLLAPIYRNQPLTYTEKLIKETALANELLPNYPNTDWELKRELVRQLGCSPQAIHAICSYLIAEYQKQEKTPTLLLTSCLQDLYGQLKTKKGESLFYPGYKQEQSFAADDQKYRLIYQSVYALAFAGLNNLANDFAEPKQQKIAKLAIDVIPLCISLDPQHLHYQYLESYLKGYKSISLSSTETFQIIELLTNYGVLNRYHPTDKNKAKVKDYEYFYIHSSCREAYLNSVARAQLLANETFNAKLPRLIYFLKREIDFKKLLLQSEQSIIKDTMHYVAQSFYLDSGYLKAEGLEWQYVAHGLHLLELYQKSLGKPLSLENAPKFLRLVNPILNISVQAGYTLEMQLLQDAVQKLIHNLPSIPNLAFNQWGELEKSDLTPLKKFCEQLATIDKAFPALYAQYIYYFGRRILKTPLPVDKAEEAKSSIYMAIAMRSIIDSEPDRYIGIIGKMAHDSLTFLRDGLGPLYIQANTNDSLIKAQQFYEALKQQGDIFNQSKCERYLAEIELKQLKLNAIANQEGILQKLQTSSTLIEGAPEAQQTFAKKTRNVFINAEYQFILAQQQGTKKNWLMAAKLYRDYLRESNYDQRPNQATANKQLAYAYNKLFTLPDCTMHEKLEYLQYSLDAINQSIVLQEHIKYQQDSEMIETYKLKANILQQALPILERKCQYETMLNYAKEAKVIFELIKPNLSDVERTEINKKISALDEQIMDFDRIVSVDNYVKTL